MHCTMTAYGKDIFFFQLVLVLWACSLIMSNVRILLCFVLFSVLFLFVLFACSPMFPFNEQPL